MAIAWGSSLVHGMDIWLTQWHTHISDKASWCAQELLYSFSSPCQGSLLYTNNWLTMGEILMAI